MPSLLLLMSSQLLVPSFKDHSVIKFKSQVVQIPQSIDQSLQVAREVMETTKYDIRTTFYKIL